MNKKIGMILVDAIILFSASTILVVLADMGFSQLKDKGVKDDPLVTAIKQNKIEELQKLIDSGNYEADILDGHNRTALMQASFANYRLPKRVQELDEKRAPMIQVLLEHGADIDAKDSHGWTPLMWASWSGLSLVVEELIEAKASISAVGEQGFSPLALASMRGNSVIVQQLLDAGADQSLITQNGESALDLATFHMSHYSDRNSDEVEKVARYQKVIALLEGQ